MKDIDEIRRRRAAATDGKWEIREFDGDQTLVIPRNEDGTRGYYVARLTSDNRKADAEFIANAPADIDALLQENESLREQAELLDAMYVALTALRSAAGRVYNELDPLPGYHPADELLLDWQQELKVGIAAAEAAEEKLFRMIVRQGNNTALTAEEIEFGRKLIERLDAEHEKEKKHE